MSDETFGARLKRLRRANQKRRRDEWNGSAIARQLGVSRVTVWMWETDNRTPSDHHMALLASRLGCTEHYLRYGVEHPLTDQLEQLRETVRAFLGSTIAERSRLLGELQVMVRA